MNYHQLLNQTLELYGEEKYTEAYEFISANKSIVHGNEAQIYNFRYSIAAKMGKTDLAYSLLEEAVLKKNFWWDPALLMEDDDLISLRKYAGFKRIVTLCEQRMRQAKNSAASRIRVIDSFDKHRKEPLPLLMALHGNQENFFIIEDFWKRSLPAASLLALPQSSSEEFSGGYIWDDFLKGTSELAGHYKNLEEKYTIDTKKTILAGFSAGASVVLLSLLRGLVPARSFLLLSPWLPEMDTWQPLFKRLEERDVRGYIVCGSEDAECLPHALKLHDRLKDTGISCGLKLVEGLKHEYPHNADEIFRELGC